MSKFSREDFYNCTNTFPASVIFNGIGRLIRNFLIPVRFNSGLIFIQEKLMEVCWMNYIENCIRISIGKSGGRFHPCIWIPFQFKCT